MRPKSSMMTPSLRTIVAVALILMWSGPLTGAAAAEEPLRFPQAEGVTLDDVTQVLPRDFKGRLNLVLMAFRRGQQPEIDTWFPELRRIALTRPGFAYYELPVIGPQIAPLRWIIRKGMGSKITEPEKRSRIILVFAEKDPLLKSLAIASEETIVALLLDEKGRVLWRSDGPWTEAQGASLRQAVEAFHTSPPR